MSTGPPADEPREVKQRGGMRCSKEDGGPLLTAEINMEIERRYRRRSKRRMQCMMIWRDGGPRCTERRGGLRRQRRAKAWVFRGSDVCEYIFVICGSVLRRYFGRHHTGDEDNNGATASCASSGQT